MLECSENLKRLLEEWLSSQNVNLSTKRKKRSRVRFAMERFNIKNDNNVLQFSDDEYKIGLQDRRMVLYATLDFKTYIQSKNGGIRTHKNPSETEQYPQCLFRANPSGKCKARNIRDRPIKLDDKNNIPTVEECQQCMTIKALKNVKPRQIKKSSATQISKEDVIPQSVRQRYRETVEKNRTFKDKDKSYYCRLKDRYFLDLVDLPCIKSPSVYHTCSHEDCKKKVMEKYGK